MSVKLRRSASGSPARRGVTAKAGCGAGEVVVMAAPCREPLVAGLRATWSPRSAGGRPRRSGRSSGSRCGRRRPWSGRPAPAATRTAAGPAGMTYGPPVEPPADLRTTEREHQQQRRRSAARNSARAQQPPGEPAQRRHRRTDAGSTDTPAEPSAFMTTSGQSPSAGSQVSCCVPGPAGLRDPEVLLPGRRGRRAAGHGPARRPRRRPQVVDDAALDAAEVRGASATGAMPTKTSVPGSVAGHLGCGRCPVPRRPAASPRRWPRSMLVLADQRVPARSRSRRSRSRRSRRRCAPARRPRAGHRRRPPARGRAAAAGRR